MRIGSSLFGVDLAAQHSLRRATSLLGQSAWRLTTMTRINRGADDPAGLIAAVSLQDQLTTIEAANANVSRAVSTIHIADSAMGQVSSLIHTIRGNLVEAAGGGLTSAELQAKQIEVDAALDGINRIGAITRRLVPGGTVAFNVSPDVGDTVQVSLPNLNSESLGGDPGHLAELASGGAASLSSGDYGRMSEILDAAQSQVLESRARLGAMEKYTLEPGSQVLDAMEENLSSALSEIRDTDVAQEISQFIRQKIFFAAALSAVDLIGQRRGMALELMR
jgi:flagellin-like hook-associated protein FlgL